MIEVEVKARAPEDMAERIAALGATLLAVENHHDLYFNSPQRDFKESDEALRIRIKEEGARLTYKGPKLDQTTKSRLERTVKIDDPLQMEQILSALGFVLSAQVKKRRGASIPTKESCWQWTMWRGWAALWKWRQRGGRL